MQIDTTLISSRRAVFISLGGLTQSFSISASTARAPQRMDRIAIDKYRFPHNATASFSFSGLP